MRGNLPERFGAYATAIKSGFLSVNDCREWEGLSRIEGGDVYGNTTAEPTDNNVVNLPKKDAA